MLKYVTIIMALVFLPACSKMDSSQSESGQAMQGATVEDEEKTEVLPQTTTPLPHGDEGEEGHEHEDGEEE